MSTWQIVFFPPTGERDSPYDYILSLSDESEKASVIHRLKTLRKLEIGDWPNTWIHKLTDKIYQLTAGHIRLMYCLDYGTIVVLHACRKVKRKTLRKDIARAEAHYDRYMSQKKG